MCNEMEVMGIVQGEVVMWVDRKRLAKDTLYPKDNKPEYMFTVYGIKDTFTKQRVRVTGLICGGGFYHQFSDLLGKHVRVEGEMLLRGRRIKRIILRSFRELKDGSSRRRD